MTTTLSCPKCGSQMRSYERNRVLVDQCTGCGGLFLDRGELEQLATAENEWHASQASAPPQDAAYAGPRDRDYPGQYQPGHQGGQHGYQGGQHGYQGGQHGGYQQPYYRKKKKSFLSELFDD